MKKYRRRSRLPTRAEGSSSSWVSRRSLSVVQIFPRFDGASHSDFMDPPLEMEWGDEGTQLDIVAVEDRESDSNESVDGDYGDC